MSFGAARSQLYQKLVAAVLLPLVTMDLVEQMLKYCLVPSGYAVMLCCPGHYAMLPITRADTVVAQMQILAFFQRRKLSEWPQSWSIPYVSPSA